jgi:hypothetical protein
VSKLDVHKAKIALHEKLFFAALAVLVTLLGWAVSNSVSAPNVDVGQRCFDDVSNVSLCYQADYLFASIN